MSPPKLACLASVSIDNLTFVCERGRRRGGHTEHRHVIIERGRPRHTVITWYDESPGASPDEPTLEIPR